MTNPDSENNDIIFSVEDYTGKEVVFTKKKWEEKKPDHPELNKKTFLDCLKRAINNPDEVWQDYQDYVEKKKNKRCYYKKYSAYTYAKAVVWVNDSPRKIVSAYEINFIKEQKYPELRQYL